MVRIPSQIAAFPEPDHAPELETQAALSVARSGEVDAKIARAKEKAAAAKAALAPAPPAPPAPQRKTEAMVGVVSGAPTEPGLTRYGKKCAVGEHAVCQAVGCECCGSKHHPNARVKDAMDRYERATRGEWMF